MREIGFVVNPIAGMGGRVGLKGTDGVVEQARSLGAEPRAPDRALAALRALESTGAEVTIYTWGAPMGEEVVAKTGLAWESLGHPEDDETAAEDTTRAVRAFIDAGVDVILFAGGDGTAVDIADALEAENADMPILGIPAGVKVFSAVFAVSPDAAGEIVGTFERTEHREVADLDEEAYRQGRVQSELRGVVSVPVHEALQTSKQLGGGSVEAAVEGFLAGMDPTGTYFLGPGGTIGAIKDRLEIDGTPLGVDIVQETSLAVADANERDLLEYIDTAPTIVVSPIGGQGFIFGRGNHQFSPAVIRQSAIEVVASPDKLDETGVLRVDTGDPALDDDLRGWTKVRTGRVERRMMEIV